MNESLPPVIVQSENSSFVEGVPSRSSMSRSVLFLGSVLLLSLGANAVLGYQIVRLQEEITTVQRMVADNVQVGESAESVTQKPTPKRAAMPSFAFGSGKTLFLMIPESWQEDIGYVSTPTLTTDERYIILTPTTESAPDAITLGRAEFQVRTGSAMELGFNADLESVASTKIQVLGQEAEQRQGFGGIGGSVFVKETLLIDPKGTAMLVSLVTQDMNMLNDLEPQYDQLLETAKVE